MTDNVVLQSAFPIWDDARHGDTAYAHGPTGIVIVPAHLAAPLLERGGYRRASQADVQAEVEILTQRLDQLRNV